MGRSAAPGFLQLLRDLTTKYGALLIIDEVMTGFRVTARRQQLLRDQAGFDDARKIARRADCRSRHMVVVADIMHKIAPLGPVYQAGTLSEIR